MPAADLYSLLQVNSRASAEVIKAAYLALVDPHSNNKIEPNSARFQEVRDAYDTLGDPVKRAAYDESIAPSGGMLIGNHKILSRIAKGGFGTTYRGEHTITGDAVCIKHCSQISPAHDAVLIAEALALGKLHHHALPGVRDLHRLDDGSLALVMDFIEHPTLEQVVEKVGRLAPLDVAWITERLLNALLYMHRYGVVHGDLKPQNVLIDDISHSAYLVDFGLAQSKPTSDTKGLGYTKWFAPPEEIDLKPLLPESDYYSIGQLMKYMLGGGMDAVKKNIVPATVPDPICRFIQRITTKHVLDRPRGDLFDEFKEVRLKTFGKARSGMRPIPGLRP